MRRFDVAIVGAGPAGAATAIPLARAGVSVLLADGARFPRDKTCGGGVTGRARAVEPCSIDCVVEDVVSEAELRQLDGRIVRRGRDVPLVYMTQRRRLDHHLVEQATLAGADLREGVRCSGIDVDGCGATLAFGEERVRAAVVVGADGANGTAASRLGLGGNRALMVALEGHLPLELAPSRLRRGVLVLESGATLGGYAWAFPKRDHLNVGVGSWLAEAPTLRGRLAEFCERLGIDPAALALVRGHRLPLRSFRSRLADGCACVVGDAAGLVDPLTGDGIYESFLSGKLAAAACLRRLGGDEHALARYGRTLTLALAPQLGVSWLLKHAFDRAPSLTYALAVTRPVWRVLSGTVAGPARARRRVSRSASVPAPTRAV